eukprot:CAMPEP_0195127300 /NCGR_PEP_ID=MMETSP0448-20130528/136706_1 /TAXON_ID=66468 /ORGANISM="Heterocapsa triquestra, Strain CCMP 448" /LENGTH=207 /DNA_ID=CAMNT_0040165031 /DNA_START=1 /DNA_END=621 /DNA_ORIENTATION=+
MACGVAFDDSICELRTRSQPACARAGLGDANTAAGGIARGCGDNARCTGRPCSVSGESERGGPPASRWKGEAARNCGCKSLFGSAAGAQDRVATWALGMGAQLDCGDGDRPRQLGDTCSEARAAGAGGGHAGSTRAPPPPVTVGMGDGGRGGSKAIDFDAPSDEACAADGAEGRNEPEGGTLVEAAGGSDQRAPCASGSRGCGESDL